MSSYKLYYFNVTGLGEPIRYLLHYVGADFEDIRFKDFDEWTSKYKKGMHDIVFKAYRRLLSIRRYLGHQSKKELTRSSMQ